MLEQKKYMLAQNSAQPTSFSVKYASFCKHNTKDFLESTHYIYCVLADFCADNHKTSAADGVIPTAADVL